MTGEPLVVTDGRDDMTVSRPSAASLAALEHLGWRVKSGPDPREKPKRRGRRATAGD